jgi:hypothetical protein
LLSKYKKKVKPAVLPGPIISSVKKIIYMTSESIGETAGDMDNTITTLWCVGPFNDESKRIEISISPGKRGNRLVGCSYLTPSGRCKMNPKSILDPFCKHKNPR